VSAHVDLPENFVKPTLMNVVHSHASMEEPVWINHPVFNVFVHPIFSDQLVKFTITMLARPVLVKTQAVVKHNFRPVSIVVAYQDFQAFYVKRISMNVLRIHAKMEPHAMIWSIDLVVLVYPVIKEYYVKQLAMNVSTIPVVMVVPAFH
jgi:hypothetical protein